MDAFLQLEDPGVPIPPESTHIHNITDAMVKGKRINDDAVATLLSDVNLVIAHNAQFDRGFVEARLPVFTNKAWACSFSQVPWNEEGISSGKLEFIAYRFGFHYEGHRASIDCHALLEVLQSDLPESGTKVMTLLLSNVRTPMVKVWALNSAFESKDALKGHGYRWEIERRTWAVLMPADSLPTEIEWLREHVYSNRPFKLELEKIDAMNRFTSRRGSTEIVSY